MDTDKNKKSCEVAGFWEWDLVRGGFSMATSADRDVF
jgi:hypothetical protein